jgi:hypothetical protein
MKQNQKLNNTNETIRNLGIFSGVYRLDQVKLRCFVASFQIFRFLEICISNVWTCSKKRKWHTKSQAANSLCKLNKFVDIVRTTSKQFFNRKITKLRHTWWWWYVYDRIWVEINIEIMCDGFVCVADHITRDALTHFFGVIGVWSVGWSGFLKKHV